MSDISESRTGADATSQMIKEPECFVVMPISDPDSYQPGHFQHVFDDLLAPACRAVGFRPTRADQVRESNMIHLDVLQRLVDSPIVLCDLSSRNPNVLFELGLRQAFDKPVVLVQEVGTPKIFDITPLRYTEYRRGRIYHEVLEDQKKIADAIDATRRAYNEGIGVNSIVRMLALSRPASLPELQDIQRDPGLQMIRAELAELRAEIRSGLASPRPAKSTKGESSRDNSELLLLRLKLLLSKLDATQRTRDFTAPTFVRFAQERDEIANAFTSALRDPANAAEFRETLRQFDQEYDEYYKRASVGTG